MKLRVHNESLRPMKIILEPHCVEHDVGPGEEATVEGEFEVEEDGSVMITMHDGDDGPYFVVYSWEDLVVKNLGRVPGPWDRIGFGTQEN